MDVFLARQPVYDRQMQVIAYELLYRPGVQSSAGPIDNPEEASSQVMVNTFMEVGIENITGGIPALINVTKDFLTSGSFPVKFRDRLIPELLEGMEIDETLVRVATQLAKQGYKFALDDFVYSPEWQPLVDIADIIKIDVMALKEDGVREQLGYLDGVKAKLLAEKVETHEEFDMYLDMGFDLFQGYFFAKPKLIQEKGVPASKHVVMQLLGELARENADVDGVVKLVSQDARLTYKLLKIVNSAFFGLPRKVNSIQEAVVILGFKELKCWASLLSLASMDDKPSELLITAMVRGKMCQLIAEKLQMDEPDMFFTAGLFSMLDALMDFHLEDILQQMPFSDDLSRAVLKHDGQIGVVLHTVVAYEAGDWNEIHLGSLGQEDIWDSYLKAIEWAGIASNSMFKSKG